MIKWVQHCYEHLNIVLLLLLLLYNNITLTLSVGAHLIYLTVMTSLRLLYNPDFPLGMSVCLSVSIYVCMYLSIFRPIELCKMNWDKQDKDINSMFQSKGIRTTENLLGQLLHMSSPKNSGRYWQSDCPLSLFSRYGIKMFNVTSLCVA